MKFYFYLDEKQLKQLHDWQQEHEKTCKIFNTPMYPDLPIDDPRQHKMNPGGTIGGVYSFIFVPNSIGEVQVVKCACGADINLTDYDSW